MERGRGVDSTPPPHLTPTPTAPTMPPGMGDRQEGSVTGLGGCVECHCPFSLNRPRNMALIPECKMSTGYHMGLYTLNVINILVLYSNIALYYM